MVRVYSTGPGASRLVWHDRNPVSRTQNYEAGGVSPHGLTERWAYTVPAGKKAILEYGRLFLRRESAPTASLRAECYVGFTPSGGSEAKLMYLYHWDPTAGWSDRLALGLTVLMQAGDRARGLTIDNSTGGTYEYHVGAKITGFDA